MPFVISHMSLRCHSRNLVTRNNRTVIPIFIYLYYSIFCYKEIEKRALCKSVSQSEVTLIVYSEPIKSGRGKINFS